MALNRPRQAADASVAIQNPNPNGGCGSGEMEVESASEEEVEKLEVEVKEMADMVLHYRRTLPDQLKEAFALLASDQRPESSWNKPESRPGTPADVVRQVSRGNSEAAERTILLKGDEEILSNKIRLFKEKTLRDTANVHVLLKRMKACISRIDNNLDLNKNKLLNHN